MNFVENQIFQFAWVVNSLERSIEKWVQIHNIGPFYVIKRMPLRSVIYRGVPSSLEFGVAVAQHGPNQIELIQPLTNSPSAYREKFAVGQEGFHHVAIPTTDINKCLNGYRQQGFEVVNECIAESGARFGYVDTSLAFGYMLEVVELAESFKALSQMISDGSSNWNGEKPIRVIG